MADWIDEPQFQTVDRLSDVALDMRESIKSGPSDRQTHRHHFDSLNILREIEVGGAAAHNAELRASARIVAWNVERLRHLDAIAATLKTQNADIMLLTEIDRGMARTGNSDRVVELADRLDVSYSYAVEFIELDLGDENEKRLHAGDVNMAGLHGAGILSAIPVHKPFLIRIERRGDWFDGSRTEPRVGGRIALGTCFELAGKPVLAVNVHLESHGDPDERAQDMRHLLRLVDLVDPEAAVVIGGDFNTSTFSYAERAHDHLGVQEKLAQDPMRLLRPEIYEPLFEVATEFGYDCAACNVADAPTTRHPEGSAKTLAKIDWFFTKGLQVRDAEIIPAVRDDGSPSSDHEALAITIAIANA